MTRPICKGARFRTLTGDQRGVEFSVASDRPSARGWWTLDVPGHPPQYATADVLNGPGFLRLDELDESGCIPHVVRNNEDDRKIVALALRVLFRKQKASDADLTDRQWSRAGDILEALETRAHPSSARCGAQAPGHEDQVCLEDVDHPSHWHSSELVSWPR